MSSLVRRSLRVTAAVAGITVAGVGLAGPALAAPGDRPDPDGAASAAPDAASTPNVVGELPSGPQSADLPQLFTIDDTSVYTADSSVRELTAAEQPVAADDAAHVEGAELLRGVDLEYQVAAPQDRDGAMQELDAASMFDGVSGPVLDSTEGNDVRA